MPSDAPPPAGPVDAEAVPPVMSRQARVAGLSMRLQEEPNWCWSSVTQAMLGLQEQTLSQQDIATEHARRTGKTYTCAPPHRTETSDGFCLPGSCTARCGDVHALDIVMTEYGLFDSVLSKNGAPSFPQIQDEVARPRPVPCRLQWLAGGGHFVLVVGWGVDRDDVQWVFVLDPANGGGNGLVAEFVLQYNDFANRYPHPGLIGRVSESYRMM